MSEWIPFSKTNFISCPDCIKCEPREGLKHGARYGICGESGNLVYLEPWDEKRISGRGYIHNCISSCLRYEAGSTHDVRRANDEHGSVIDQR